MICDTKYARYAINNYHGSWEVIVVSRARTLEAWPGHERFHPLSFLIMWRHRYAYCIWSYPWSVRHRVMSAMGWNQVSRVTKYQYSKNWLSARKKWQKVVFISKVYIQLDIEQIFTCRVYIGFYFCLYSTMEYQLNILFMIFEYLVNTWWILCKVLQRQRFLWYVPKN